MSDGPFARQSPGARAAAWRRWQMDTFDLPTPLDASLDEADAPTEKPAEPPPDFDAIRAQARQEGFEQGRQQGFEQGHAEGHAQGVAAGHDEGRQTGHSEGYAAGLAEGQALARAHAEQLKNMADELSRSLLTIEEDIGQGLIALALDIARKVVGDTLAQHPEAIVTSAREVMHADPAAEPPLRLWVHPDDLALINGYLADEIIDSNWRIATDASLTRGGCRAETAYGAIDATLETRWRRVAAALGRVDEWKQNT